MSTRAGKRQPASAGPVVRRAFSMQEADAELIETLRLRYATLGLLMNQSEVVRVGLHALARMADTDLEGCASNLERLAASGRAKASK